jgi:hypothetical protein
VNHEAKVGGDHPVLRIHVAALDALGKLNFLGSCEQGVLRGLLEEQLQRFEIAGLLVPLVLLGGRLVQALDVAPPGSRAAADAASEFMLLLGVAVRGYSFRCRLSGAAADTAARLLLVRPLNAV